MDARNDGIDELNMEEVGDTICRTKKRRLKVAILRVNQRKLKLVNSLYRLKYYNQERLPTTLKDQDDSFIPSIPCHAIFVFLDTILLGVLQVEYQNKKESPLEVHTVHMQTFLISICIYCMLIGIKIYMKTRGGRRDRILSFALLLFGLLSTTSLLSILLPQQLLWIMFFIWGSISIILARCWLKILVCRIREVMMVLIFKIKGSAIGSNNTTNSNPNPVEQIEVDHN
ncbi:unnamed protein product [Lathyrus sativus]|nr:unnamed protein product [Lathyrus sativus]